MRKSCEDSETVSTEIEHAEPELSTFSAGAEKARFYAVCSKQLASARTWALADSCVSNATTCAFVGMASCCSGCCQKKDSMGGSEAISIGIFHGAFLMKDLIETLYTCCWARPINTLESLEERYAHDQCFIPHALWQTIKDKFRATRMEQFSQQKSIAELSLMLDCVTLKPKEEPVMSDLASEPVLTNAREALGTPEAQRKLFNDIDHMVRDFFDQYEPMDEEEYANIVDAIFNFVNKVVLNRAEPHPLFLVGPWGTGKTHFFSVLQEWIDKLLPDSIYTESVIISTPDELQGGHGTPGLFLETLLKTLRSIKKRGAIIFLDEATWLTDSPMMLDCAKRAFSDEKFSKLVTDFFGAGKLVFNMTPTLFLVASNDPIKDAALNSRFKPINFPNPKKATLVSFAKSYLKETPKWDIIQTLSSKQQEEILAAIERDITACPREYQNYRAAMGKADTIASKILIRYNRAEEAEKTKKSIATPTPEAVRELALRAVEKRKTDASVSGVFPDETKKSQ